MVIVLCLVTYSAAGFLGFIPNKHEYSSCWTRSILLFVVGSVLYGGCAELSGFSWPVPRCSLWRSSQVFTLGCSLS